MTNSANTSQAVNWWRCYRWCRQFLDTVTAWPMAGSVAWCDLDDSDPRKLAAVLDAGQHHILRVEVAQAERAEASRAVTAAEDWAAVARRVQHRPAAYIPRERGQA